MQQTLIPHTLNVSCTRVIFVLWYL